MVAPIALVQLSSNNWLQKIVENRRWYPVQQVLLLRECPARPTIFHARWLKQLWKGNESGSRIYRFTEKEKRLCSVHDPEILRLAVVDDDGDNDSDKIVDCNLVEEWQCPGLWMMIWYGMPWSENNELVIQGWQLDELEGLLLDLHDFWLLM